MTILFSPSLNIETFAICCNSCLCSTVCSVFSSYFVYFILSFCVRYLNCPLYFFDAVCCVCLMLCTVLYCAACLVCFACAVCCFWYVRFVYLPCLLWRLVIMQLCYTYVLCRVWWPIFAVCCFRLSFLLCPSFAVFCACFMLALVSVMCCVLCLFGLPSAKYL